MVVSSQDDNIAELTQQVESLFAGSRYSSLKVKADNLSPFNTANNQSFSEQVYAGDGDYVYVEPTCWRCGQKGHIKNGCMVRLEHSRRHAAAYRISQQYNMEFDAYRPYNSRFNQKAQDKAATVPGL